MAERIETLFGRLEAHHAENYLSLHMPGHKENAGLAAYLKELRADLDITELPGFDDLHDPQEILKEISKMASDIWGSRKSWLQVNGSTGGILAGIRAATKRGDRVLVARNCHKAVWHAIELCGLDPICLMPRTEPSYGLAGSISPEDVEKAFLKYTDISLVIITSPSYDGILSDTARISSIAHKFNAAIFVDEAHGAHLGFGSFPDSAVSLGADLVVSSLHKVLPSLTQTAILHAGTERISFDEISRQSGIFQSSSPSYLLMASMDGCIRLMSERKKELFSDWEKRLDEFDRLTQGLTCFRLLGHGKEKDKKYPNIFELDPAKILIYTGDSGISGKELFDILRDNYHIELEMALEQYAIAMTGLGTDDSMPKRLADALISIDAKYSVNDKKKTVIPALPGIPERRLPMESAAKNVGKRIELQSSVGCISAESVWAYPPGIPLILPGEIITEEILLKVNALWQAGIHLVGTRGNPPEEVVVLLEDG